MRDTLTHCSTQPLPKADPYKEGSLSKTSLMPGTQTASEIKDACQLSGCALLPSVATLRPRFAAASPSLISASARAPVMFVKG